MKISSSKLIRIRDNNEYHIDVDKFIKYVEDLYKIDFRTLPNWKHLVKKLHVITTDCQRRIHEANTRKSQIIAKLFIEWNKPSTFELTDNLTRTSNRWNNKKNVRHKKTSISPDPDQKLISQPNKSPELSGEMSETGHPNTEVISREDILARKRSNIMATSDVQIAQNQSQILDSNLPVFICTNQHKLLPSIGSQYTALSNKTSLQDLTILPTEHKEWLTLKQSRSIKCSLDEIRITNKTPNKQAVHFILTNCSTDYLHIRFKSITEKCWFKMIQLKPVITIKLYPGMSTSFTLKFQLFQIDTDVVDTYVFFKVSRNLLNTFPPEALLIPIDSQFLKYNVKFSEIVQIPPAFSWHIGYKHPVGVLKICTTDESGYVLHIVKRNIELEKDSSYTLSLEGNPPNTDSLQERIDDHKIVVESKPGSLSKGTYLDDEEQSINILDLITSILEEVIVISLESFFWEFRYLTIKQNTKYKIPIHFLKPEHVGVHQCYYDLEFCDPSTEKVLTTKTIKVFAEVLPHPIQIYPYILDMSNSPVTHGICEDRITLINSHKLYPVTVKFKLTTKMKRIFKIIPAETLVLPKSKFQFTVRLCSKEAVIKKDLNEMVHFTIKIIIIGDKFVYNKIPPLFYEIIAPCVADYRKIYNDNYFRD